MPCNGHQNCLNKYLTFQQTSSQCSHFRSNYRKYSVKKVFLKISQNSRESTCTRVSLLKILKEIFKNSFLQSISSGCFCHLFQCSHFFQCWMLKSLEENDRSSLPEVLFYEKGVLQNIEKFTGKQLSQCLFLNKVEACDFIKKETLAQVFSCEFCEIFKKTFFMENLWWLLLKWGLWHKID